MQVPMKDNSAPPVEVAVTFSVPFENPGLHWDNNIARPARTPSDEKSMRHELWYLGIGRPTATAALAAHLLRANTAQPARTPRLLVISGFAGALNPQIQVGDVLLCENMSDSSLIQRLLARGWTPPPSANLHTSEELVSSSSQKKHLRRITGSDLVDMETRFLLEIARFHSIPVITIRVVSDDASMDFPVPEHILYNRRRQCTRPLALCAYLAIHPRRILGFTAMLKASLRARAQLGPHLRAVLQAANTIL